MSDQRFQEFYDQYADTRYPFMDTCTLIADTKQLLDPDLFLDASLYPIGNTGPLNISKIIVQSRLVSIFIANTLKVDVASTSFDPFGNNSELLVSDTAGRPAGVIVSEPMRLSRFSSWLEGTHAFTQAAATFVPSCVIPVPASGVRGIATSRGNTLTGNVLLVGGRGVVLRQHTTTDIRVDVIGDPLFRRSLCSPINRFDTPLFVQTINGCPPDQYGNIQIIIGDQLTDKTVVRLQQIDGELVFTANGTAK